MLHWSIALVAIPLAAILLSVSPAVHRIAAKVGRRVWRLLNHAGARSSRVLDLILRPRDYDGGVGLSRLVLWSAMNSVVIAAIYGLQSALLDREALTLASLLAAYHMLLASSAILKIAEENRIMQVGQPKCGALFAARTSVRNLAVIGLEAGLVIVSVAVLLDIVSAIWPGVIMVRTPATGVSFIDHLLCLLSALPAFGQLIELTEFAGRISFGGSLGSMARGAVYAIGSTLLLGAVTAWLVQRINIGAILSQLEDAESDDAHFLQLILSRAPEHIKADLLTVALDAGRPRAQLRAINTMRHLKVWTFPQTFLHNLERFDRRIAIAGLNQIRDFLAVDGALFADPLLVTGLQKALQRYVSLSPKVTAPIEDAVLSRLGALVANYANVIQKRAIVIRTTREHYGVMLEVAKSHKDADVRRTMAKALMRHSPNGFILDFLVNMHERSLGAVDIEIIEGFVAYAASKRRKLGADLQATITKRIGWTLRNGRLTKEMSNALAALLGAIGAGPSAEAISK